jgi:hypothetical protein
MRSRSAIVRPVRLLVALLLGTAVVGACGSTAATPKATAPKAAPKAPATVAGYQLTQLKMEDATGYVPKSINGGTDDYHCTLVNPNVTQNSFIVSSQFFPGSGKSVAEVHHAIMFLVPPALAAAAEKANNGGKGWTCFGEPPVLGTGLKQFLSMPWLSAWAPGKGKDVLPATTGTPLPKGSLIVMQVHYNLLAGDLPVHPRVELDTVPAAANLRPTSIQPLVAIPNIPCPAGVTGPLCNRQAELANLSKRFGPYITLFDAGVEQICGENPSNPPVGLTTSCTWPVRQAGYIIRAAPHMHLLGTALSITLNPGTPGAKTVLNVPNYDFNNQAAHDDTPWIKVVPGDKLQVSCTYNPKLAQELPALRQLPSHFVTWGDGTSDEMCLGLAVEVPLDPHATVDWSDPTGKNHVGAL